MSLDPDRPTWLLLFALLLASADCSQNRPQGDESASQIPEEGQGPVRYPRTGFAYTPLPDGIRAVVVPLVVVERTAVTRVAGSPTLPDVRPSEIPTPLAGPGSRKSPASAAAESRRTRRAAQLRSLDWQSPPERLGDLFVLATGDLSSAAREQVRLEGELLKFETGGGRAGEAALISLFASVAPRTTRLPALVTYDPVADRLLVAALEVGATDPERSSRGGRLLIAVSDDSSPLGDWFLIAVETGCDLAGARLLGAAADSVDLYLVVEAVADGGARTVMVWAIEKGLSGGPYEGGPARFEEL